MTAASAVGADYASIRPAEGEELVFSVRTVTLAWEYPGRYGVAEALNNVACSGAAPIAVLASVLLPTASNEQQLKALLFDLDAACAAMEVALIGGHTEVSRLVEKPLVTLTGIGSVESKKRIPSDGARPGMEVVIAGYCGVLGTTILALRERKQLRTRYSDPFLDDAIAKGQSIDMTKAARAAARAGAASIHDISQGGVFAALWEIAEAAGVGLEVFLKKLPIRQQTIEICEFFDLNPYKLITGGGLVIAAQSGEAVVSAIEEAGGSARIVGRFTDSRDRVLLGDGERRFLETPQTDELLKIYP